MLSNEKKKKSTKLNDLLNLVSKNISRQTNVNKNEVFEQNGFV